MRKAKRAVGGLIGIALFLVATAANAAFQYLFHFDAASTSIGATVYSYGAASFGFTTPLLLTDVGDSAPVVPSGNLNGYAVTEVTVNQSDALATTFTPDGGFFGDPTGTNAGDVIFFFFEADNYAGLGRYPTTLAGRDISSGNGLDSFYVFTSGNLTVSSLTVPEPATLALLGVGIAALSFSRRRKLSRW